MTPRLSTQTQRPLAVWLKSFCLSVLPLTLVASLASAAGAPSVEIPAQPELKRVIADRDTELFNLTFEECDPKRMETLVTADLEFYHDKGGLAYRSGQEMVLDHAKRCRERQAPGAWRSRRELVPSTLHVDPVPGYGAIEVGEHIFYERQGDGPETAVGRARFANVWRLEDGVWRLARVLSYAHQVIK